MMTKHQWAKRSLFFSALVLCTCALIGARAAGESEVPKDWNVDPVKDGVYLETFDTKPDWVTGDSDVTAEGPGMAGSGLPERANTWASDGNVLELDTKGDFISNPLKHDDASDVSFADEPVYVDMRVLFSTMDGEPTADSLDGAKLAIYTKPGDAEGDSDLVVVHADGNYVHGTALEDDKWCQVTVKLFKNSFDVFLNDTLIKDGLTPIDNSKLNVLQSVDFYGTKSGEVSGGYIDDLYVSHGSPARTATAAVPFPAGGELSGSQTNLVAEWMSRQTGYDSDGAILATADELGQAYLLGELQVEDGDVVANAYSFGVSKIEMQSPTLLTVTLRLTTNEALKNGTINGHVRLYGKVKATNKDWNELSGAITPSLAEFTNGEATYQFTIPGGGYKVFQARIVP